MGAMKNELIDQNYTDEELAEIEKDPRQLDRGHERLIGYSLNDFRR